MRPISAAQQNRLSMIGRGTTALAIHLIPLSRTIRIIALIPTFALMYFITIYLGLSAVYLMPWVKVFESVALASFFFLACDYLSPNLTAPVNQTIHLGLKEDSAPLSSEDLKDIRVSIGLS